MPDSTRVLVEESRLMCRSTWRHIQDIRSENERLKRLLAAAEDALAQSRRLLDRLAKPTELLPHGLPMPAKPVRQQEQG